MIYPLPARQFRITEESEKLKYNINRAYTSHERTHQF